MKEHFLWCEKYRPQKLVDCVLPDAIKSLLQKYIDNKEIPNLMFFGGPGVGKTTAARALCEQVGCDYMMINGSEERGIDMLRTKIKSYASTMSFAGGSKVVIIDEADFLTADAQAAFRGIIEEFAKNCTFIFTCNNKNKIIDAIHSRCSSYNFTIKKTEKPVMARKFLERLEEILKTENVSYTNDVLAEVVIRFFPDYRKTINELQKYSNAGAIDAGILGMVSVETNIKSLMKYLKDKDFKSTRKWIVDNSNVDSSMLFRSIFDSLYEVMEPASIPQAVLILAEYQYKAAFVADQEINTTACLTDIMGSCEFK